MSGVSYSSSASSTVDYESDDEPPGLEPASPRWAVMRESWDGMLGAMDSQQRPQTLADAVDVADYGSGFINSTLDSYMWPSPQQLPPGSKQHGNSFGSAPRSFNAGCNQSPDCYYAPRPADSRRATCNQQPPTADIIADLQQEKERYQERLDWLEMSLMDEPSYPGVSDLIALFEQASSAHSRDSINSSASSTAASESDKLPGLEPAWPPLGDNSCRGGWLPRLCDKPAQGPAAVTMGELPPQIPAKPPRPRGYVPMRNSAPPFAGNIPWRHQHNLGQDSGTLLLMHAASAADETNTATSAVTSASTEGNKAAPARPEPNSSAEPPPTDLCLPSVETTSASTEPTQESDNEAVPATPTSDTTPTASPITGRKAALAATAASAGNPWLASPRPPPQPTAMMDWEAYNRELTLPGQPWYEEMLLAPHKDPHGGAGIDYLFNLAPEPENKLPDERGCMRTPACDRAQPTNEAAFQLIPGDPRREQGEPPPRLEQCWRKLGSQSMMC